MYERTRQEIEKLLIVDVNSMKFDNNIRQQAINFE
jgi:hypothetical protein